MSPRASAKPHATNVSAADAVDLSRQLMKAQEEERRRISRELHDETGQALMVLRFHLEMLAGDATSQEEKAKIRESLEVLDRTIEGLRRIIARLSPRVLEEFGLLTALGRQTQFLSRQTGMKAHVELPEDLPAIDHDVEVVLYRSVQEALHNIRKHSGARSFNVRLRAAGEKVLLEIEDDGVGFSTRTAEQRGFGLTGMRERVAALAGSMKVHSERGKGTQIRILLPRALGHSEKNATAGLIRGLEPARAS
jgi:two-component system sensor histidine kinase UhpB